MWRSDGVSHGVKKNEVKSGKCHLEAEGVCRSKTWIRGGSVTCGGGEDKVNLRTPGREAEETECCSKVSASVSCSKLDKVRKAERIFYKSSWCYCVENNETVTLVGAPKVIGQRLHNWNQGSAKHPGLITHSKKRIATVSKESMGEIKRNAMQIGLYFGLTARESCRKKLPGKKVSSTCKVHGTERAVRQQEWHFSGI